MLKFEIEQKEETPRSRDVANPVATTVAPPPASLSDTHRVRPDELAEALSAIERKQRKAFTGTIPLEQTLSEMKVEATEEEVWLEIQARRQEWQKNRQAQAKKKRIPRENLILGSAAAFALLIVSFFILGIAFPEQASEIITKTSRDIALKTGRVKAPTTSKSIVGYGYGSFYQSSPDLVAQTPTMKHLSEIKDGEVLSTYISNIELLQKQEVLGTKTQEGAELTERLKNALIETKPNPQCPEYVRYNHQWYLRGWTTQKPIAINLNGSNREVQRIIYYPQPMKEVNGISVTPGQTIVMTQKQMSFGPANKQVQIPIKFIPAAAGSKDRIGTFVPDQLYNSTEYSLLVDPKNLDSHAWDKW